MAETDNPSAHQVDDYDGDFLRRRRVRSHGEPTETGDQAGGQGDGDPTAQGPDAPADDLPRRDVTGATFSVPDDAGAADLGGKESSRTAGAKFEDHKDSHQTPTSVAGQQTGTAASTVTAQDGSHLTDKQGPVNTQSVTLSALADREQREGMVALNGVEGVGTTETSGKVRNPVRIKEQVRQQIDLETQKGSRAPEITGQSSIVNIDDSAREKAAGTDLKPERGGVTNSRTQVGSSLRGHPESTVTNSLSVVPGQVVASNGLSMDAKADKEVFNKASDVQGTTAAAGMAAAYPGKANAQANSWVYDPANNVYVTQVKGYQQPLSKNNYADQSTGSVQLGQAAHKAPDARQADQRHDSPALAR